MKTIYQAIVFFLLVGSGIWVYRDANQKGNEKKGYWAFGCMFFWPIIFPLYLVKHVDHLKGSWVKYLFYLILCILILLCLQFLVGFIGILSGSQ